MVLYHNHVLHLTNQNPECKLQGHKCLNKLDTIIESCMLRVAHFLTCPSPPPLMMCLQSEVKDKAVTPFVWASSIAYISLPDSGKNVLILPSSQAEIQNILIYLVVFSYHMGRQLIILPSAWHGINDYFLSRHYQCVVYWWTFESDLGIGGRIGCNKHILTLELYSHGVIELCSSMRWNQQSILWYIGMHILLPHMNNSWDQFVKDFIQW